MSVILDNEVKSVRCWCGLEAAFVGKTANGRSRITKYIYLDAKGHRINKNHYYKGKAIECPLCNRFVVNELDREAIQELGMCLRCDNQKGDI
jgi:hypothetical protein